MPPIEGKPVDFIREVTKYFMDFLETDFHKRKLPKRSLKLRDDNNLLVGLNLQKYPSFRKQVLKLINDGFKTGSAFAIQKNQYKTTLPKNLLDLVSLQIENIVQSQITNLLDRLNSEIEKNAILFATEHDVALTSSIEAAQSAICQDLVHPFIEKIEKPLQNQSLGTDGDVFLIEKELTEVILKLIQSKVSELLNQLIAKNKISGLKELKSCFELSDVKSTIRSFFDDLQIADIYSELFELERSKAILDKQEFYLYFCDISFGGIKYPIFYIPVSVSRQKEQFILDFDPQVYINKKAIEYVAQEYNAQRDGGGTIKSIAERKIYLSEETGVFTELLDKILQEISSFFDLDEVIRVSELESKVARSQLVKISNEYHFSIFDKSDEALVNDYEDILLQLEDADSVLAGAFNSLIEDFIHKNPTNVNREVESEWNEREIADKLVSVSPIPLNSEQHQILSAIQKEGCKYIAVQGPPGTGKSHTITAIVFDAILKNQSVLVLSDKKEALDVVEDKLTQTMDKVRFGENFQNPILRLGSTGTTYGKILSQPVIAAIRSNYQAVRSNYAAIEENIEKITNSLKEDVEAEALAYGDIDIHEIHEYLDLEAALSEESLVIDRSEAEGGQEVLSDVEELRRSIGVLGQFLTRADTHKNLQIIGCDVSSLQKFSDLRIVSTQIGAYLGCIQKIRELFTSKIESVRRFTKLGLDDLDKLDGYIREYENLNLPVLGFMLSKKKVALLDAQFKGDFIASSFENPHQNIEDIKNTLEIARFIVKLGQVTQTDAPYTQESFLESCHQILINAALEASLKEVDGVFAGTAAISDIVTSLPKTALINHLEQESLESLFACKLATLPEADFQKVLRYYVLGSQLREKFESVPGIDLLTRQKAIEDLVTTKVNFTMDGRLIDFYYNNAADAASIKSIIKNKQRFPKEEFSKLKSAFPCIIAGIRDYAEYIPLEPDIFDLLIIDEASQVSIAQAFPALLRAKKVLILGDKKQFSNIKAAQAKSETNREHLNVLGSSFRQNISDDGAKIQRLDRFNIKTSVLEFFEYINNYNTQLKKHFRGYKEIISYSNKYFYQNSLEVMKIRGKSIDDVIKFTVLETGEKIAPYPNSNLSEVDFIISELKRLKEENASCSIGIITPHTNQQKLLSERITSLPEYDHFDKEFNLKIMTFDTCQGEERDIIYYSMVASEESDRLWGVFIKDLNAIDIEDDGQIKAQRLNVGLSRGKETLHFVLSKPIELFAGSIGEALRHYQYICDEARKEKDISEVDGRSKMEPAVLNWFYQTPFWIENRDKIEFLPQFEIGKYLKQLDITYTHPAYKVDFLVVYRDETHKEHKIIIEYDGFKEHFQEVDGINAFNYQHYYSAEDVYRQKVLESYGYKFLRINRFNAGQNQVECLDERLKELVKNTPKFNPLLNTIHQTVQGIQNGNKKECPKCKQLRETNEFKDAALQTGFGRFCCFCKKNKSNAVISSVSLGADTEAASSTTCPKCSSKMILRNGRRGPFYGCSKFPYCKGTRNA